MEFVDLTGQIEELAAHVGIRSGFVHIQSLHAATAIVVDACEPLRLSDVDALLPAPSASMSLADGRVQLGRCQRVFLVELDGPRVRDVSVIVLLAPAASSSSGRSPTAG